MIQMTIQFTNECDITCIHSKHMLYIIILMMRMNEILFIILYHKIHQTNKYQKINKRTLIEG